MSASLSVVARGAMPAPTKPETVGERVRELQEATRILANEAIHDFAETLQGATAMAAEIAGGGEAFPPGVRDIARRFVIQNEDLVKTIQAITARNP